MQKKIKHILLMLISLPLALLAASILYLHLAIRPSPAIFISPETTLLTSPLRPDGSVDYLAAINQSLSKNITPQNNAFVALLPAIGTSKETLGPAYLQILNLAAAPESPGCWIPQPKPLDIPYKLLYTPWQTAEHPDLDAWLNQNEPALAIIASAVQRDHFWYPLVPEEKNGGISSVNILDEFHLHYARQIRESLQLRAMRSLAQSNPAATWNDLRTAHRFCHLYAQQLIFIEALIGANWDARVRDSDQTLLATAHLDKHLLQKMLADIQSFPPLPTVSEAFHRVEIYDFPDAVQTIAPEINRELATQPITLLPGPDWNRMLREGNAFFAEYYAPHNWSSPQERAQWMQSMNSRIKHNLTIIGPGTILNYSKGLAPHYLEFSNAYTTRLTAGLLTMLTPQLDDAGVPIIAPQLFTLACALQLYHFDHNTYPDSLTPLAPVYLPAIPEDFYHRPLTYTHTPASFKLLSTGPSTTDPIAAEKSNSAITLEFPLPAQPNP